MLVEDKLPPMERKVFEVLLARRGIVSRQTLMDDLYSGVDDPPYDNIIKLYVYNLRRWMRKVGEPFEILNFHGRGYMLQEKSRA